ncbi:MAG: NADH-quinone oxidoreductase subunit NuoH [Tetrasphaera sp.]
MSAVSLLGSLVTAELPAPSVENPVADFSDTPLWLSLLKALFVFAYLLIQTLLVIWFERRVIGRMQQRPGPNRFGPLGLFQTLADGVKLALKEDITPKNADKLIYLIAPAFFASMAFVSFSIIPLGPAVWMFNHYTPLQLTDLPVAVLLVLAVAGVGAYGVVLAGWSSGSTYPLLGGLRSSAQIISYEIAMGLSLVAVFIFAGSMSTSQIVAAQHNRWFILPCIVSFVIYVITMVGETNRLPFDLAEGEGELTAGFMTEYSSMKFAMFFLGEYINMFTVSALATTVFLGGWQAPPGIAAINSGMFNHGWWPLLWFTLKMWLFLFFFVWLRGSLPRTRYDQFMHFGWKFLIPVTIVWVVAVAFIQAATEGWLGTNTVTVAARTYNTSLLIVIGVLALLVLTATWIWDGKQARKAEAASPAVPDTIDPFAGGYPVPPLPGQRLSEPAAPATSEVVHG